MHDEQQNKNADINSFVMLRNCSFPTTKNTETNVAHILNKNKTNKHHNLYYQNEKFYSI